METVHDDLLAVARSRIAKNATLYFCKSGVGTYRLLVPRATESGAMEISEMGFVFARLMGLSLAGSLDGCKYHIVIDRHDIYRVVHRFSMLLFEESCLSVDTHL